MAKDNFDDAVAGIQKTFGKGAIMPLNQSEASEPVDVIPCGVNSIDSLTGIHGIAPRGRITEIFGPESSGKSTLCLQVAAQAQKMGGRVGYIDMENALDMTYAEKLGVNPEMMWISQPDAGEDGLEIAHSLIKSKGVALVIVDSVAALTPRSELEGDFGDAQMGLQARMMSQAMRKMNAVVKETNTSLIFINQVRQKIGVVFGNPETTSGGVALKFFASLRISLHRAGAEKSKEVRIGDDVKIRIDKNKFAAPFKEAKVKLRYGFGFVDIE